jgi:hypothetical protein
MGIFEPSLFLAIFPYLFIGIFPIFGLILVTKWVISDLRGNRSFGQLSTTEGKQTNSYARE